MCSMRADFLANEGVSGALVGFTETTILMNYEILFEWIRMAVFSLIQ